MTTVFLIEGINGVGKTTTINSLMEQGFCCVQENFMGSEDKPTSRLHPQSLILEMHWATRLLMEVVKLSEEHKIIICDRSPFTACIYTRKGGISVLPCLKQMDSILNDLFINCVTIKLVDDKEVIWDRVLKRLEKEPEREKYGEGDRKWFDLVWDSYECMECETEITSGDLDTIVAYIKGQ